MDKKLESKEQKGQQHHSNVVCGHCELSSWFPYPQNVKIAFEMVSLIVGV